MNTSGCKHTNLMNAVVYLPEDGRGLKSLEQTYKEIKKNYSCKMNQYWRQKNGNT